MVSNSKYNSILAINGGDPVREKPLYYGHQWITDDDVSEVVRVVKSDYLTCGPEIGLLEEELCNYTGASYAVVVSNGTAALHCACLAAGIGEGDEVITTPLTFAASANCVRYCDGTVVFADVDIDTYNISAVDIRHKITKRTKAIIAVDYTGQAVACDEIRSICDEHGLLFIEDAAHAIGTEYNGKRTGNIADITCFSFHPVKSITCGEGGAIMTNNPKLYKRLLLARTHGITHDKRDFCLPRDVINDGDHDNAAPWYYEQISLGYNYRLTDFQSALLRSQLSRIDHIKAKRKEIVKKYDQVFSAMPELVLQKEIPESDTCRHLYILRLNLELLRCDRRGFFDAMRAENIYCQVHYIPVYWFPDYRRMGYHQGICPNAETIYRSILSLPLYPTMTDKDVEDVINAVKKVVSAYRL